jgi:hypothetical protein
MFEMKIDEGQPPQAFRIIRGMIKQPDLDSVQIMTLV